MGAAGVVVGVGLTLGAGAVFGDHHDGDHGGGDRIAANSRPGQFGDPRQDDGSGQRGPAQPSGNGGRTGGQSQSGQSGRSGQSGSSGQFGPQGQQGQQGQRGMPGPMSRSGGS